MYLDILLIIKNINIMNFVLELVYKINLNLIRLKSIRNKNVNVSMFIDLCFNIIRSNKNEQVC